MFTRFVKEFENTIVLPNPAKATLVLGDTAMLETRTGWTSPTVLKAGQQVATLDGGFATILEISRIRRPADGYFIPAGALGSCSGFCVPGDGLIGLEAPLGFSEARSDHISLPVHALEGHFGVRRAIDRAGQMYQLTFADEEMLWTNTGCLVHASTSDGDFFDTLSFGQARAFLNLLEAGYFEQKNQSARPAPAPFVPRAVYSSCA